MTKFEEIKNIAPGIIYINGNGETVPPPVDADTANMIFVKYGGYTLGFSTLTDGERAAVESLLNVPTLEQRLAAAEEALLILTLGGF